MKSHPKTASFFCFHWIPIRNFPESDESFRIRPKLNESFLFIGEFEAMKSNF